MITDTERQQLHREVDGFIDCVLKSQKKSFTLRIVARQGKISGSEISINKPWEVELMATS